MAIQCPNCSTKYERIGTHWSQSSCEYPAITTRQEDIIKGLLLGDGSLETRSNIAAMVVSSTNREFLEWVNDEMGVLCTGEFYIDRKSGKGDFNINGRSIECEFKDAWRIRLRSNPHFEQYRSAYTEQEPHDTIIKVPFNSISPMVAKIWYCSDGGLDFNATSGYIRMTVSNLSNDVSGIRQLFSSLGFSPRFRKHMGYDNGKMYFTRSDTRAFINWIGDSIPGFEYKWCIDDKEKYDSIKP